MKKAEIYRKAQLAILRTRKITDTEKLEALRELVLQENIARYREEAEGVNDASV